MDDLIALVSGDLIGALFLIVCGAALVAWLWEDVKK